MASVAIGMAGQAIDLETFADLMEPAIVLEQVDIGNALIFKVDHPIHGPLVLVNTASGSCAMLRV